MKHNTCEYAPPGTEGTSHGATALFGVTIKRVVGTETIVLNVFTCAEHLMPVIVWAYGSNMGIADVHVAPIFMSWPQDWEKLLNDRVLHAFVRFNYPGGKDGLCGVVVDGDRCLGAADEHVVMAAPGAADVLDTMDPRDYERAHAEADELLLSLVPAEVREAYERLVARAPHGNWPCA